MQEIAVNTCFGGFSLSDKARDMLFELKNIKDNASDMRIENAYYPQEHNIRRDDKDLITVIKKLKKEADGVCAELKIVKVPDDVKWYIQNYDGVEEVHEEHRIWF